MPDNQGPTPKEPEFEQVALDRLVVGRRGKHHALVSAILTDLEGLPANAAMKVPASRFVGTSPGRLRSAVSRATKTRDIRISTHFDGEFLYIWRIT